MMVRGNHRPCLRPTDGKLGTFLPSTTLFTTNLLSNNILILILHQNDPLDKWLAGKGITLRVMGRAADEDKICNPCWQRDGVGFWIAFCWERTCFKTWRSLTSGGDRKQGAKPVEIIRPIPLSSFMTAVLTALYHPFETCSRVFELNTPHPPLNSN